MELVTIMMAQFCILLQSTKKYGFSNKCIWQIGELLPFPVVVEKLKVLIMLTVFFSSLHCLTIKIWWQNS